MGTLWDTCKEVRMGHPIGTPGKRYPKGHDN